jgi:hypothetical protein
MSYCCVIKPQYTWPGLIIVLLGDPGVFPVVAARTAYVSLTSRQLSNEGETNRMASGLPARIPRGRRAQPEAHPGRFPAHRLGVGAIIGAGIFVMAGLGAHYAGPGLMLSSSLRTGLRVRRPVLRGVRGHDSLAGSAYTYAYATLGEIFAWIIGWDLTLEYAMGASTVSSGWSNHFIELLKIFHIKMPLWLAYDHWTALRKTAENVIARQMASAPMASLVPRHAGFSEARRRSGARNRPNCCSGPTICWARRTLRHGDRFQPAGLSDRAGDHRDSGDRHQRERALQFRDRDSSRSRWCSS